MEVLASGMRGCWSLLWTAFTPPLEVRNYILRKRKGARLGYTLISNHAFVDGNKRIGMYVMLTFLEVNGIRLTCSNEDVVQAGLSVATGSMTYEELLRWVLEHKG